jgi:hypothetical protein
VFLRYSWIFIKPHISAHFPKYIYDENKLMVYDSTVASNTRPARGSMLAANNFLNQNKHFFSPGFEYFFIFIEQWTQPIQLSGLNSCSRILWLYKRTNKNHLYTFPRQTLNVSNAARRLLWSNAVPRPVWVWDPWYSVRYTPKTDTFWVQTPQYWN